MEKGKFINRRHFMQVAAAAAGALVVNPVKAVTSGNTIAESLSANGNRSNFKGVQVGAITYSFREQGNTAGDMLLFSLGAGVGSVELMGDSAETFVGKPNDGYNISAWRKASLEKYKALANLYRQVGIDIHIIKNGPGAKMSDDDIDYVFEVCKAVGAMGVTTELSLEVAERCASFAEKHGKYLIFHNHGQPSDPKFPGFDAYLKYGKNIMLNFDAGHYFGYTGKNPCDVIREYHNRIASIHLKDKTSPTNASGGNQNQPWGKGETPLPELLQLIASNSGKSDWPTHCDIELEYQIPYNSTPLEEVKKCVEYCKNVLK